MNLFVSLLLLILLKSPCSSRHSRFASSAFYKMSHHHGMPFLVVNYGAEMIFILDQRLQAQNVSAEKASKVLQDVIKAMFSPTFVDELLRPQPLYTAPLTKEIFDRLAHSSIMRLSENSMDKLYDLMTMGCKYQYVTMRHPYELIELTLNHLENVKASLTSESEYLRDVEARMQQLVSTMPLGTLADTRHQLLNFFQGKRIKVSLFLQENMQNADATLNIPVDTSLPPLATSEAPGTIRYFDQGALAMTETFPHPDAHLQQRTNPAVYSPMVGSTRQCTQGTNLYLIDRKKKVSTVAATASADATATVVSSPKTSVLAASSQLPTATHRGGSGVVTPPATHAARRTDMQANKVLQVGALNSLSSLIVGSGTTAGHFKFNIFEDPHDDEQPVPGAASISMDAPPLINISKISKEEVRSNNAELMGVVGTFDTLAGAPHGAPVAAPAGGGADDLLDLMDSA